MSFTKKDAEKAMKALDKAVKNQQIYRVDSVEHGGFLVVNPSKSDKKIIDTAIAMSKLNELRAVNLSKPKRGKK